MSTKQKRRVGARKSRECRKHTSNNSQDKQRREYDLRQVHSLNAEFFARDPRLVAPDLLGKVLVRHLGRERMAGRIVEVEAYLGTADAAAHAAAGLTPRNRVLFGPPGHAYVYFIYGNHYCLNVSCMPEGRAGCVLFRALEPMLGIEMMARHRGILATTAAAKARRMLTTGPGRLCEAFHITRPKDNDKNMTEPSSGLWIGDDGFRPVKIVTTTRVGITKSPEQPLRYYIEGNEFVS